jgi:hypothetical protein
MVVHYIKTKPTYGGRIVAALQDECLIRLDKLPPDGMTPKQSGSGGADEARSVCEYCGGEFDPRGLPAHERSCDAAGEGADDAGDSDGLPFPVSESFYREHSGWLGVAAKAPEHDRDASGVAKAVVRRHDADKREAFVAIFGPCPAQDCENGKNGFDADGCAQHPDGGEPASDADSAGSEPESGDGDGLASLMAALIEQGYAPDEAEAKAREMTQ